MTSFNNPKIDVQFLKDKNCFEYIQHALKMFAFCLGIVAIIKEIL